MAFEFARVQWDVLGELLEHGHDRRRQPIPPCRGAARFDEPGSGPTPHTLLVDTQLIGDLPRAQLPRVLRGERRLRWLPLGHLRNVPQLPDAPIVGYVRCATSSRRDPLPAPAPRAHTRPPGLRSSAQHPSDQPSGGGPGAPARPCCRSLTTRSHDEQLPGPRYDERGESGRCRNHRLLPF